MWVIYKSLWKELPMDVEGVVKKNTDTGCYTLEKNISWKKKFNKILEFHNECV